MSGKNKLATSGVKYRLHKFPPLHQTPLPSLGQDRVELAPEEYQKQLQKGFQQGIEQGFTQGVIDGKEEGYEEGVRLGYDEGMKKGRVEGRTSGKDLFTNAIQPFSVLSTAMQDYLNNYEVRRRDELMKLVERVTRQVIRCELALQPTQLLTLVEEALASLPTVPKQLKIYLNAEEFARINDVAAEKVKQWGLQADVAMEPGECRVVTETTEMDVGCQHRLDQCIDVLKSNLLTDSTHD
ncbi:flagellar assembly protein FliH [Candidatus Fukatsuia symbiotica]|uniref:Flagellar assembly protein FliH n=1 Tax=Candidatus Fukatsuia symbiotica TaxID=1878942 RepID=A0A2U8I642_9GAMM|nr:flagellar assembly protein FliH [Candidatus Fukatsuia symbiotica]AWK14608.1 flagellar assembly protein FliH [Candidatus Fukatsuia symbiotica]MEA9444919.1 flagellar assembly protein FliH [Candidatus Fukatsuia symbiotica]